MVVLWLSGSDMAGAPNVLMDASLELGGSVVDVREAVLRRVGEARPTCSFESGFASRVACLPLVSGPLLAALLVGCRAAAEKLGALATAARRAVRAGVMESATVA